jgi:hypothetical protein
MGAVCGRPPSLPSRHIMSGPTIPLPGAKRRSPRAIGARLGSPRISPPLSYLPAMLRKPTLPAGFIPPCLPVKAPTPPSGGAWLHEIKHDGFRFIARKDGARVRSRPGNDLTRRFRLIAEVLARLRSRSCIIDGEAVACDDKRLASFDLIRHHRTDERVFLYAFDLLELNGTTCAGIRCRSARPGSVLPWPRGPGIRFNSRTVRLSFATRAKWGSKASSRSERTQPTARGARRIGSR